MRNLVLWLGLFAGSVNAMADGSLFSCRKPEWPASQFYQPVSKPNFQFDEANSEDSETLQDITVEYHTSRSGTSAADVGFGLGNRGVPFESQGWASVVLSAIIKESSSRTKDGVLAECNLLKDKIARGFLETQAGSFIKLKAISEARIGLALAKAQFDSPTEGCPRIVTARGVAFPEHKIEMQKFKVTYFNRKEVVPTCSAVGVNSYRIDLLGAVRAMAEVSHPTACCVPPNENEGDR